MYKRQVYLRADVLADAVSLKKNIIITGSHGKTTTTSLVGKILSDQRLDPTIINGGVINSFKSNAKLGKGDWAILEADESDGSFLKLPINYSIVTNIDYEHLDYYKSEDKLEKAFVDFANKVPFYGSCAINADNPKLFKLLKYFKKPYTTYGIKNSDVILDYQAKNCIYKNNISKYELYFRGKYIQEIEIDFMGIENSLLGQQNVYRGGIQGPHA